MRACTLAVVTLLACRGDRSQPEPPAGSSAPSASPDAPSTAPELDTVASRLRRMLGATQGPDAAAMIAKLEAMRATASGAERALIDRSIAVARATEVAMAERDLSGSPSDRAGAKARQLHRKAVHEAIALLDEMAAFAAGDVDALVMIGASFNVLSAQIESLGLADDISPRTVKQKARALADRLVASHPKSAKAWGLVATVAPYRDIATRYRAFARCAKLDPAYVPCRDALAQVTAEYAHPYCEGVDVRPIAIEWREISMKPITGYTPVEHAHARFHLAPAPRFTLKDVVRVQAGESRTELHDSDGKVERSMTSTVGFELAPATLEAMTAWTRALEQRGDGYALLRDGKVLFVERRALPDEGQPGLGNTTIDELCTKTQRRAVPALD